MSGPVIFAPIGPATSRRQMSRRSARAGRELALAVFPLSITDTGGVSRHESEPNGRPHGRARYLKTSGAAGATRLVRERADRDRVRVCVYARSCARSRCWASSTTTDDGENEDNGDAGRETVAAWRRTRTARSDTHGRALKPREENCARFPGAKIRDERRRKRRQRKEEIASSSWT